MLSVLILEQCFTISLQACGIGQGHEVLVPSITYVASFQAISATGAVPVSCDIDMENMQISLINLKKNFQQNKSYYACAFCRISITITKDL